MPGVYSSKRNLLFDLDGTLVDSAPAHARAFVAALSEKHPALVRKFDYDAVAGRPTLDVFAELGLQEPELGEIVRYKQRLYREALDRGETLVFPGAVSLLARLAEGGRRLFLVTGSSRLSATRILAAAQLDKYFSGVVTAEDVPRGKPAPDPYLFALHSYRIERADSVAIEDGIHGLDSARAARLDVVSVHGNKPFSDTPHARNLDELFPFFFP